MYYSRVSSAIKREPFFLVWLPYKPAKAQNIRARFRAESGFLDYDGVVTNTMSLPDSIATNVLPSFKFDFFLKKFGVDNNVNIHAVRLLRLHKQFLLEKNLHYRARTFCTLTGLYGNPHFRGILIDRWLSSHPLLKSVVSLGAVRIHLSSPSLSCAKW
jgi:hypothetical protein